MSLTLCNKPWTYENMTAEKLTLSIRWETRNQLPRGTTCLQAKNTIVSLSLWVRLRIKKMSEASEEWCCTLATTSDVLELAGAPSCVRCHAATSVNNYRLRLCFRVVTPPLSKTFIKNRSCSSQSRGDNSDLKAGEVGSTFRSRHFIWGFCFSPRKSCFVLTLGPTSSIKSIYKFLFHWKKQILIEKSWESVGAFNSLISQRSRPAEPDFLLTRSSKPMIHLP